MLTTDVGDMENCHQIWVANSSYFDEPNISNGVTYCIDENGTKIAETLKWDSAPVGSRFDECDSYRYWIAVLVRPDNGLERPRTPVLLFSINFMHQKFHVFLTWVKIEFEKSRNSND